MKIIPAVGKTPKLTRLGVVRFGSAFRFHDKPQVQEGSQYGKLEAPHILTSDNAPARVVNLENGNVFRVDFNSTYVEVLGNATVTL